MGNEQEIYESKKEIAMLERREYFVVKGNDLIQKSRYALSLTEQKIVAFICSMIKPNQEKYELDYEISIREYCKICNINYDSGKNYADIKACLQKLSDKSIWLPMNDGEHLCRWLSKVVINGSKVKLTIDIDMAPYLFGLKKKYTQYQLIQILGMKSVFSIRMYEILQSYANLRRKTFEIDEFRKLLMLGEKYNNFFDLRRHVIDKSITEINELTNITTNYQTISEGRKVIKLIFDITQKQGAALDNTRLCAEKAVGAKI